MSSKPSEAVDSGSGQPVNDENEIFKSLSHQIRRDIIKALGQKKLLSFTEIKNSLGNIDSPTLSYHLKSLKLLVTQKDETYLLTDIGQTALLLMDKIDQSDRLKNWKRNIRNANIITIICWAVVQFVVPLIVGNFYVEHSVQTLVVIVIILNVVPQINFQFIWRLWAKSWVYNPGKTPKNGAK